MVDLVLIGGIALWLMYAPNQGTKWESYITAAQRAYRQADCAEAEKQSAAALKEAEAFDDVRLATSLNNLALLYKAQCRYAEAEPLYQRALAIREKALGPQHPDLANSLNNLAILYQVQGRYEEAETNFVWALVIREDSLGLDHPSVAASLEDYAALLRQIGRSAEATEMDTRAEAIHAKHTGTNR